MKISERTISALGKIITGDNTLSIYRSGPELVHFFNEIGSNDVYGQGFPSRWKYTEDKIRELNGTKQLTKVFEILLDLREFINTEIKIEPIVDFLNNYLKFDGYELVKKGEFYKIQENNGALVEFNVDFTGSNEINHLFIQEQIKKCNDKISDGDYTGAITNARSLVEAVLIEIERKVGSDVPEYDGDLVKLYRRVRNLINLDPARKDISDSLKQILSGLNNIITGLAGIRNKMSDSHVITYRPSKHHAKLAVNSAYTLCDFIFETFQYQVDKGILVKKTEVTKSILKKID